ncbi:MAG: hypothetical protein IH589_04515 [Anaerolineales bacterium]|nr:hypothetical protein [Anaerolineales bacterium]
MQTGAGVAIKVGTGVDVSVGICVCVLVDVGIAVPVDDGSDVVEGSNVCPRVQPEIIKLRVKKYFVNNLLLVCTIFLLLLWAKSLSLVKIGKAANYVLGIFYINTYKRIIATIFAVVIIKTTSSSGGRIFIYSNNIMARENQYSLSLQKSLSLPCLHRFGGIFLYRKTSIPEPILKLRFVEPTRPAKL